MQKALGRVRAIKAWRIGLMVAVLVAVAGGAGLALGAIPDTTGVIHGCYLNKIGTLRVIDTDAGQKCASFETPIQWNQTGPVGPTGPQGSTGPHGATGPQGPAGANGVSGYQIVSEEVPYSGSPVHQVLSCPMGKVALGAGQDGGTALSDFPTADGSGWDWYEESGPAALYVICANAS